MIQATRAAPLVTCYFSIDADRGSEIRSVEIKTDIFIHKIDLTWAWAAPIALRQDVIELFSNLIRRCVPQQAGHAPTVNSSNFIAPLAGLRFEGLQCGCDADGQNYMSLRLTRGKVSYLLTAPDHKKIDAQVEDVFLPLTNLSAYLKAMKEQAGDDGPARAMSLTADRLDEFLLVYGERLQDAGGQTGLSS